MTRQGRRVRDADGRRHVDRRGRALARPLLLAGCLVAAGLLPALPAMQESTAGPAPTLDQARLTMGKWIETQQIISKERKEWQQGRELLTARVDLVKQEIGGLEEKLAQAQTSVDEADRKRGSLDAENNRLKAADARFAAAVTALEVDVRKLFVQLPEPIRTGLQKLYQRMPEDPATTRASSAERFQNVIGILNEVNRANSEITVSYEVRELADGKPAEVKVLYVGIAQAYYVSARGEAGIGRPGPEGWVWTPANKIANDVLTTLEILEGKHTPAFVPLPVKIQ